jgi:hypothetical protein
MSAYITEDKYHNASQPEGRPDRPESSEVISAAVDDMF